MVAVFLCPDSSDEKKSSFFSEKVWWNMNIDVHCTIKQTQKHISNMANANFKLKQPQRQWIIKVDSTAGSRNFYIETLKPTYGAFWFWVGQFIQKHEIKSIQYIGRHMTYDHFGNDTEEIFETINRKFPVELIEAFNNEWK